MAKRKTATADNPVKAIVERSLNGSFYVYVETASQHAVVEPIRLRNMYRLIPDTANCEYELSHGQYCVFDINYGMTE